MTDLISLLSQGYFPEELPPPFVTNSFAREVIANLGQLPNSFTIGNRLAKTATHSVARVDILRRPIGIPNPILFFNLCQDISQNWQFLSNLVLHSTISSSIPKDDPNLERALIPFNNYSEVVPIKARVRSKSKWILRTDISKFYSSIYTHSIPWAIHGKPYAKAHRGFNVLGNSLDRWIRNGQDGQTIGLPIGPDTSLLFAELILCNIDQELNQRIPNLNCMRFVDDYEFGCKSYSEAEIALATLQELLREYELDINIEKTKIIELPIPIESSWVSEIRHFNFRDTAKTQYNDIVQYFSRCFELSIHNPNEYILKYAVRRIRYVEILNYENFDLLQNLLFQCVMVEAGTLQAVLEVLIDCNIKNNYGVNLRLVEEVLNSLILHYCPIGYTNETAWAIWGFIHWNLNISQEAADVISKSNDNIVVLLALDARNRGLIPSNLNTTLYETYMTGPDLYSKQWLLSYEANKKGWLPSAGVPDHVASDNNFGLLKAINVDFYDTGKFISAKTTRFFPYDLLALLNP